MAAKFFRVLPILCLALACAGAVEAQEVSRKKEIAVFNLSYYKWSIPGSALGGIDEQIRSVFINLGRFSIIGMTYRLGEDDVSAFIDSIKKFKAENAVIPDKVQMGKEFFTAADFNKLIGSFIVVIPSVAAYNTETSDKGETTITVRTSFTFVNVEQIKSFAQFFVETKGTDKSADKAIQKAIDGIPDKLSFETRKIDEFKLRTGILEVKGGEVMIELGRNMGVNVGDEYLILVPKVLSSGKQINQEKGMIVVREVGDDVSTAVVLFSEGEPQEGEQLQELPRFGTETTPYAHIAFDPFTKGSAFTILAGARQSFTKGFFSVKPFAGIELPLNLLTSGAAFVNLYGGGELGLTLGRLTLAPLVAVGVGGRIWLGSLKDFDFTRDFSFSHAGGMAGLGVEWLFNRDMKFVVEGGYMLWYSLDTFKASSYGGVYAGGGLTIKY